MVLIEELEHLLATLGALPRMELVELALQSKGTEAPPTFRGRCLDPAYLEAVAGGLWDLDDEACLASFDERIDAVVLPRVRLLDRRALRSALRGAALAVATRDLVLPGWQQRCTALARTWVEVVGPLPQTVTTS